VVIATNDDMTPTNDDRTARNGGIATIVATRTVVTG